MTIMLAGIASVALLVGGLDIMNIMLVSLNERARSAFVRRWVPTPGDMAYQFMIEALLLGIVGGGLGLTMGYLGTGLASRFGLETLLTAQVFLAVFVAAVGIATIFGVYPAFSAARLEPIESLPLRWGKKNQ